MRATYEDLLRAARRLAVDAHGEDHRDQAVLMAGWQSVVTATGRHLRWLRGRLPTEGQPTKSARRPDTSLGRLAQAIGAGADLLAIQDPGTAAALDNQADVAAARAEVAAIALTGARVVLRDIRTTRTAPEYRQLNSVMEALERLAQSDVQRCGLGALGGLATGAPSVAVDNLSLLAQSAARWERAHESVAPLTLLTRDLRSTTAQLRTVCGYTWHLADRLLSAAPAVQLDARLQVDLRTLKAGLRTFDAGAMRVAQSWQRRVSDVSGQSSIPGEVAFLDLSGALNRVIRRDGLLLQSQELVPSRRAAAGLLDAIDELVCSADRVCRLQQHAVAGLILEGRLFVPRRELARLYPVYLRRPGAGSRSPQSRWVRTNLPSCFDGLTDALAWSADHLTVASDVARRMAGTSYQSRPYGEERTRMPPPYLEVPNRPRRTIPRSTGFVNPGQEPVGLDR
jgi:hypothetical protein